MNTKYAFICVAMMIAIASVVVSDMLIEDLAQEERRKMEVLSEAQRVVTSEDAELNMALALKIITENTSVPVILCDENGQIISSNNLRYNDRDSIAYEQRKLQELKTKNPPVVIDFNDGTYHYLYYDDSIILKRLNIYPYAQLTVVFIFILIAFLALSSTKRAEQNKVWVGLSKETAHQLGTPISSLLAWMELLRTKDIEPQLLDELNKDVKRLETIAERFSKIGSHPAPTPVDINHSLLSALDYMRTRISPKVTIRTLLPEQLVEVWINEALFAWVVENLVKNAVDAMEGMGEITISVEDIYTHRLTGRKLVRIDVSDTGKGISKSKFKAVFTPGYTTKARGWGLGLSLVKRIIESYHGRIYVRTSEIGKGTTFRLELKSNK